VYFRAWRLSSGPYLTQLEEHCLQDLMFSAVHAPRTGAGALFHTLKAVSTPYLMPSLCFPNTLL